MRLPRTASSDSVPCTGRPAVAGIRRPQRGDHQQPRRVVTARHGRQQVDRGRIAPVQILEHQQQRLLGGQGVQRLDGLAEHASRRRADDAPLHVAGIVGLEQPRQLHQPGRRVLGQRPAQVGPHLRVAEAPERVEHGQVRLGDAVLLGALPARHEHVAGRRQERVDQRRLARPRLAGHDDDLTSARECDLEVALQEAEVGCAADDVRRRCGRRRRDADRLDARGGCLERRILLQHAALQLAQRQRRLDADLVQVPAHVLVGRERVGLAPRPVQRDHQLPARALAQGMPGHELLQLRDQSRVPAERQVGLDALLGAGQP